MINKVRAWGNKDATCHLQASHESRRNMGGYRTRTANFLRLVWTKMGLPPLTKKSCEQNLDCCDAVMSILCWLFVPFWSGERQHGGETEPFGAWRGTPTTDRGGSTKLGFITEEYSGAHRWRDGLARETIG